MDAFGQIVLVVVSMVVVSNFVLSKFLGLCPFLGVTRKSDSALGMGLAVIFVMAMTSVATFFLFRYLLEPGPQNLLRALIGVNTSLTPVLKVICYILVIAALVQFVEIVLKKSAPALYRALGIYLPLITTNCAVLGVALLNTTDAPAKVRSLGFAGVMAQGIGGGVGFLVAMMLMSGIRERLDVVPVPKALRGTPIALICTGMMALAFMGFQGMIRME
ncbi:MAG: Rnf-Nqr domain containing protein [Planctomycetota bacterium]